MYCSNAKCPPLLSHRETLALLEPPEPVARKDPKETVERPDLQVALVRWELLDPQDLPERRVAPVVMDPL